MTPITKAILPVAGLGTRFLPATKAQPKEMLPLVDKPMIQFLVEEAVAAGITEIIFVTGKGKRALEDHFDSAPELERTLEAKGKTQQLKEIRRLSSMANFTYVRQKQPRGDGDALLAAAHLVGEEPVAVLFGDDIILGPEHSLVQMVRRFKETQSSLVGLEKVSKKMVSQYGIATAQKVKEKVEGKVKEKAGKGSQDTLYRIQGLVEKPDPEQIPSRLGVVGKYIITPPIWRHLQATEAGKGAGELRLIDALKSHLQTDGELYGCTFSGQRFDCGSKIGFLKATVQLGLQHPETGRQFRQYLRSLR